MSAVPRKDVAELEPQDFVQWPVWEFDLEDESEGETVVRPVTALPVTSLGNRIVGLKVLLANGVTCWATLNNISLTSTLKTAQFMSLSVEKSGNWFHLSRYFDVDHERHGPGALARFLGMDIQQVFPIHYDLSAVAVGEPDVIKGVISSEPLEKMSDAELIRLAVQED